MRRAFLLALFLSSGGSFAQVDAFFGSGKPPTFVEEEADRRFLRSGIGRALSKGTREPHCQQVLRGLFTVLAEAAPTLHKRDETFYVDAALWAGAQSQLSSARFNGGRHLALMIRRVMIDRRLPPEWLKVAEELNRSIPIIDMGKLRFLAEGVRPIDSFAFTLPALLERYHVEVVRATSAAAGKATAQFRDSYLDREVAWGDLTLVDIRMSSPAVRPKKRGTKQEPKRTDPEAEEPEVIARLEFRVKGPPPSPLALVAPAKPEVAHTQITAKLAPEQYIDINKLPRGKRLLVRGRFWEMSNDVQSLELREALLFEERDWELGAPLADSHATALCPFASDELGGTTSSQPGGFGQH